MNAYELAGPSTVIPACPVAWSSLGCYSDSDSNRALGYEIISSGATVESCTAACGARNFLYAGLEYHGQCFCDDMLNHASSVAASFCNTPCSANGSETCGGSSHLSLYTGAYEPGCEMPVECNYPTVGCYRYVLGRIQLAGWSC